jgi:hypothetical protein
VKKLKPWTELTGKCRVCGKPTALLIHEACGKSLDKPSAKPKRLKAWTESQISALIKGTDGRGDPDA